MPSSLLTAEDLFECTQCGDCCKGFGGTYVTHSDIAAIADYLGVSVNNVQNECCSPSGNRQVLAQRSDGYCVFWEQNCTIHPVKPRMCRRWPFLDSLLVDISNWHAMANSCPGIRCDFDDQEILAYMRLDLERRALTK